MSEEKVKISDKISYYFLRGLSGFASMLPFPVIYFISDIAFLLLYFLARYRRKIVRSNLVNSFPEKPLKDIRKIERKFYRHFCDYAMESMVLPFISDKKMRERFIYKNPEIFDPYFEQKRSFILVAAHYGNWEMSLQIPKFIKHKLLATYKPQSNKGVDRFFMETRERFGVEAVSMTGTIKRLVQLMQEGTPVALYLLADQRPFHLNVRYWTMFLNQETPILSGPEKISHKYNLPVFYFDVERIGRGRYEASFRLLEENPASTAEFVVTEKHVRHLESVIRKEPAYWLWSHRRWRHKTFLNFLEVMGKTPDSPGVEYNHDLIRIP